MKHIFYLLTATLVLIGGQPVAFDKNSERNWLTPIHYTDLFNLEDAEKILGERAHLTDSVRKNKNNVWTYNCAYTANLPDSKSGKTGTVYFMIEDYSEIESAKKTYASIMESNKKNGITMLDDLGDEAYFHTDKQNFYFILVRKGERMFRMKVNKITSTTSLDEFNKVARKITAAL